MKTLAVPSTRGIEQTHDLLPVNHVFDPVEFNRFILDPIGYGEFDLTDPISLDQYLDGPIMHTLYAASLA